MQKISIALLLSMICASSASAQYYNYGTGSNSRNVQVDGYTNSRGTYVQPYNRTAPNSYEGDNYNARGNYNPYNGRTGNGW